MPPSAAIRDPPPASAAGATPAHVHSFAYGPGSSGRAPSSSTIMVRHRELPAPAYTAIGDALRAQGRSFEQLTPDDRLFPVSAQAFYLNLRRTARRAGLAAVAPHVLRHTAAKLRRTTCGICRILGRWLNSPIRASRGPPGPPGERRQRRRAA